MNPLLNKKQTAEMYGVSERTIDRWMVEGVLPAEARVHVGGVTRFRTAVLLDHIAEQSATQAKIGGAP